MENKVSPFHLQFCRFCEFTWLPNTLDCVNLTLNRRNTALDPSLQHFFNYFIFVRNLFSTMKYSRLDLMHWTVNTSSSKENKITTTLLDPPLQRFFNYEKWCWEVTDSRSDWKPIIRLPDPFCDYFTHRVSIQRETFTCLNSKAAPAISDENYPPSVCRRICNKIYAVKAL